MREFSLYTISYEGRTWDEFLSLLQKYEITKVVDIRAVPNEHSDRYRCFSGGRLARELPRHLILYDWMGNILGEPKDVASSLMEVHSSNARYLKAMDNLIMPVVQGLRNVSVLDRGVDPAKSRRESILRRYVVNQYMPINVYNIHPNGRRRMVK